MSFLDRHGQLHQLPDGVESREREAAYGLCARDGKLLLISQNNNTLWEVPGGGVDPGEDFHGALKREYEEETGYDVVCFDKKPFVQKRMDLCAPGDGIYVHAVMMYYVVEELGVCNKDLIDPVITDIEWLPFGDITEEMCTRFHYPAISEFIRSEKG